MQTPAPGATPPPDPDLAARVRALEVELTSTRAKARAHLDPAEVRRQLAMPFPASEVEWRPGKVSEKGARGPAALALAYIDARAVINRLDDVCGVDRWTTRHVAIGGSQIACEIAILFEHGWVSKSDGTYVGDLAVRREKDQTKEEGRLEMEGKGSFSGATKRAAVSWGIGRYLYDVEAIWADVEKRGNSWVFTKEGLAKLDRIADKLYRDATGKAGRMPAHEPPPEPAGARPAPPSRPAAEPAAPPQQPARPQRPAPPVEAIPFLTAMDQAADPAALVAVKPTFQGGTPEFEACEDGFADNAIRLMDSARSRGAVMAVGDILRGRFSKESPRHAACAAAYERNVRKFPAPPADASPPAEGRRAPADRGTSRRPPANRGNAPARR